MTKQVIDKSLISSTEVIQLTLTLKMPTTAQVVETSVTANNNSPIHDNVDPDDLTQFTYEMTPGFKPSQKWNKNKGVGSKSKLIDSFFRLIVVVPHELVDDAYLLWQIERENFFQNRSPEAF